MLSGFLDERRGGSLSGGLFFWKNRGGLLGSSMDEERNNSPGCAAFYLRNCCLCDSNARRETCPSITIVGKVESVDLSASRPRSRMQDSVKCTGAKLTSIPFSKEPRKP